MKEIKKEVKNPVSLNAGQTISKRILVADDNKAIRDIVSGFLKFIGYEVALAGDHIEALTIFLLNSFDLVLTDLEMPALDGFEVTRRIRQDKIHRLLPIILVIAMRETEDRVKGKDAAATIPDIHPSALRARVHKFGIGRPETKESD